MPIYDYKCSCGYKFELLRKISERDERVACTNPKGCSGLAERAVTAPAFVHGGFYDSLSKK